MNIDFLLLKRSFKTGWKRLTLIAGSVAVGIAILLSFTAVFNAFTNTEHDAWTNNIFAREGEMGRVSVDGVDPVYVFLDQDTYNGQSFTVYDLQTTGDNSPEVFAGMAAPQVGEFYASPELVKIIEEHPEQHLEYRYGTLIGVIPDYALLGRDALMVARGVSYPLDDDGNVVIDGYSSYKIGDRAIYDFNAGQVSSYYDSGQYTIAKSVVYAGVIVLLFPVMMLLSIATRLGSVQREQRYATLRLIGATNQQVARISALETVLSAAIGIIVGSLLYLLVRPLLYNISLTDYHYWTYDITVSLGEWGVIAGITLLMSLFTNWWGMRKVRTSPLGVSRKQKMEKKPGWWRVLPLIASIIGSVYFTIYKPDSLSTTDTTKFMYLIVLTMFSLVIITPWLTYHLSNVIAKATRRPVPLIGMKYIHHHARAVARSVSGVVLALFAGSFYILGTSGVDALYANAARTIPLINIRDNTAYISYLDADASNQLKADIANGELSIVKDYLPVKSYQSFIYGKCLDMDKYFTGLDCSQASLAGINTAEKSEPLYAGDEASLQYKADEHIANSIGITVAEAASFVSNSSDDNYFYLVTVDGTDVDTLRSVVAKYTGGLQQFKLTTVEGAVEIKNPYISPAIREMTKLAYGAMAATMLVAIVSISISTTGSLLERRATMYSLRLSGMQVSELRRMVMAESLLPLVIMSLISATFGAWQGIAFTDLASESMTPVITPTYIAVIFGSLAVAAIIIYVITGSVDELTSPESNRVE